MIVEVAPAKINLFLHVGPVRADGLHELQSLFFFTDEGDRISVEHADALELTIDGPFAAPLLKENLSSNLVFKAALALKEKAAAKTGASKGAKINLEKNLPIAAGIGGGSADAAAALRGLIALWELDLPASDIHELAFNLGADIPACLSARPQLVSGAGETLSEVEALPPLYICLVNPGVETPTGPIFNAFDLGNPNPALPQPPDLDALSTISGLTSAFRHSRNDLEIFAIDQCSIIREVIDFLASCRNALGARMSGSGATCFALFDTRGDAEQAAKDAKQRGWWSAAMGIVS